MTVTPIESAKGKKKKGEEPLPEVSLEDLAPHEIPLDQLVAGNNPRADSTWNTKDLAKSIKQHGVLQPILVRPMGDGKFEIIAGARRYEAAKAAGLRSIPAMASAATDEDAFVQALVENLQREELPPLDEARAFKRLIDEHGLSQKQLGNRVGRSQPYISNSMRLLELPPEVQEQVQSGKVSVGHAKVILSLPEDEQVAVAQKVVDEKIPVADLSQAVRATQSEKDRQERYEAARQAELDEAIQVLKDAEVAPERVVIFHSKELAERVREAGFSAGPFESGFHQQPSYECDCDGLMYTQWGSPETRLNKVCLVQAHYEDWIKAINAEKRAIEATNKKIVDAQRKKLAKAIAKDGEISSRLLLFNLLGDPYTTYGGDNESAKFMKRHKGDPRQSLNGLWDVLAGMDAKDVNEEIINLLAKGTIHDVFAENARWANLQTWKVRMWLVDHAGLDEAIVWGGHEPITEEEQSNLEAAGEENVEYDEEEEADMDGLSPGDTEIVVDTADEDVPLKDVGNSTAPTPGQQYPTEKRETDPAQIQDAPQEVYDIEQPSTEGNPEKTPAEEAGQ